MNTMFEFRVLGCQTWDRQDDNIDVEIVVESSTRYSATFFTIRNVASLFEKNRTTGECASGTYLWAANMILVRDLERETIRTAIDDLVKSGEIETACYRHS